VQQYPGSFIFNPQFCERWKSEAKSKRSEAKLKMTKKSENGKVLNEQRNNEEILRNRHELGRLQNMNSHARKHHLLYARFLCHRQKQISLINKIPPSL
jgi:hypothetical protein